MTHEFKVGDIVVLKSGGPRMCVESFSAENGTERALCSWFTDGLKPKAYKHSFPVVALVKA